VDVWHTSSMKKAWTRGSDDEDNRDIRYLPVLGFRSRIQQRALHTVSPNLAIAGRSVGGASRWRSIPSRTRTNFCFPSRRSCSCTARALMFSHLPYISRLAVPPGAFPRASAHAAMVRSKRCRAVTHSCDFTTACVTPCASSTDLMMLLLPVASRP